MRRSIGDVKIATVVFTLHGGPGFVYSPRLAIRRRSSVVERILGKAEVQGSNPCRGTMAEGLGAIPRMRPPRIQTRHRSSNFTRALLTGMVNWPMI